MKKASKTEIAKKYALALYEAAAQTADLEKVFDETQMLKNIFSTLPESRQLSHPSMTSEQKKDLIEKINKTAQLSETMSNFMFVLADGGQFENLCAIFSEFKHIFYQKQNIKEVTVESVCSLSAAQNKKLRDGLEKIFGQKVVFDFVVNQNLLGGLVIHTGSLRIDDSLSGKLNRLEQVMKGSL